MDSPPLLYLSPGASVTCWTWRSDRWAKRVNHGRQCTRKRIDVRHEQADLAVAHLHGACHSKNQSKRADKVREKVDIIATTTTPTSTTTTSLNGISRQQSVAVGRLKEKLTWLAGRLTARISYELVSRPVSRPGRLPGRVPLVLSSSSLFRAQVHQIGASLLLYQNIDFTFALSYMKYKYFSKSSLQKC